MGNFTFEGQGAHTYLVYQMDAEEPIDRLGLGMLTGNKIPGLLPVTYMQVNGQGYVKYNISSKICAKNFFAGAINRKRLLGVLAGVAEAFMSADDYMLDRNSILLDLDYIYADVTTCDVSLVCVPVINMEARPVDMGAFFKQLVFGAQFDQTESFDYVTKILNYLNGTPLFSLPDFKELIDGLRREETVTPAKVQVVRADEAQSPVQHSGGVTPAVQSAGYTQTPEYIPAKSYESTPECVPVKPVEPVKSVEIPGLSIPGMDQSVSGKEASKAKGFGLFSGKKAEPTEKPEKQEKKSLFGWMDASEKKPAKEKAGKEKAGKEKSGKAAPMGGFSIPGMDNVEIPGMTPTPQPAAQGQKSGQVSVETPKGYAASNVVQVQPMTEQAAGPKISSYQGAEQVTYQAGHANFGNTVNLSKAPAGGKTTLLGKTKQETKPYLLRSANRERIDLVKPLFHIGQEPGYADYCIMDNPAVSHAHADIMLSGEMVTLVDTNSTNGTFVNGSLLNANVPVSLKHGDKVTFANEEFVFYLY